MFPRLISLLIGYGFGLFQTAYIYGRLHGIDIRTKGSGNAGTTNALRTFGTSVGFLVFAGDCLKAVFALLLIRLLFSGSHAEILPALMLYAGGGCVLGHNYPFYMNFKGGKGVACTAGVIIVFSPLLAIIGVILFCSTLTLTHYVSLGSLLLGAEFLIGTILLGQTGLLGISGGPLIEVYAIALLIVGEMYFRHRENIKRLISGTERKTYVFKKGTDK